MDETIARVEMSAAAPGDAVEEMMDNAGRSGFGVVAGNLARGVALHFG